MEPLRIMKIKAAVNRINATIRELDLNDAEIEIIIERYDEVLKRRNRNHTKPYKLQYFAFAMSIVALATSTLSLIIRLLSVC